LFARFSFKKKNLMQSNEKANDKENLQANQQPKKTWHEPVLTNLNINGGSVQLDKENTGGTISNPG
jgi:hypothetical protein